MARRRSVPSLRYAALLADLFEEGAPPNVWRLLSHFTLTTGAGSAETSGPPRGHVAGQYFTKTALHRRNEAALYRPPTGRSRLPGGRKARDGEVSEKSPARAANPGLGVLGRGRMGSSGGRREGGIEGPKKHPKLKGVGPLEETGRSNG